ncbi:MAG: hypothetical protein IH790_00435 [Acidobacteria bacterium]|nr:hypothetical protein [Acidobacteriota bacterium]
MRQVNRDPLGVESFAVVSLGTVEGTARVSMADNGTQLCILIPGGKGYIFTEDPDTFIPSAGQITAFHVPGGTGVRVDTASYSECVIHPYYDSLIAKLIVHGRDREEALSRMSCALEMFIVEGIQTSIPKHRKILADPNFLQGNYHVGFLSNCQARPVMAAN